MEDHTWLSMSTYVYWTTIGQNSIGPSIGQIKLRIERDGKKGQREGVRHASGPRQAQGLRQALLQVARPRASPWLPQRQGCQALGCSPLSRQRAISCREYRL